MKGKDEQRKLALELRKSGLSGYKIAQMVGVVRGTVYTLMSKM